ncbi:NAD(P)-dependent alcohol dehydrogenase [Streptomyces albipurpureus]|uniref:alcohol dehydrogenase n=1 Tax=Streptomyces albipurpureus TaxID=2897419 RepID=A0ABT0UGW9_9ACTN|nr:NAD(P)-dependent alcohol dehydrogenase [Streptomyces sp. CWNU-1]MCM2387556.1 NAD(P)-dependent alcohol dehydrogenase [Streptomyces sp. CWNU-1]
MKALQYRTIGSPPEVVDIPTPEPGPGQILLKVTAAGVCHSDIAVMSMSAERLPFPLPLTLGHEGAGIVAGLGDGVTGVTVGDAVVVYGPWGCGVCPACASGRENYCPHARTLGIHPPGLGSPGAMAEYLVVDDVRHLVPIGDLDPVAAVPLTDAGLTPYHAIRRALPKLVPGSTAVVIGTGGLGHLAIQLLRNLTPARIVALDVSEDKLQLARSVGAHEALLSDENAATRVRELTGGLGARAVLDFVGIDITGRMAVAMAGLDSDVQLVGLGGGAIPVGFAQVPYGMSVTAPYWGSRTELADVIALAQADVLSVRTETYSLDEAPLAYERLHDGKISGRAVILPNA